MAAPLLTTKLYIPPVRPECVSRPRLIERLNAGLDRKLTLVSAPAGFGKTTLLSEWVHSRGRSETCPSVAWVSLDKGDNDPARFWAYVIAALQTVQTEIGETALVALGSRQPPPVEAILNGLINEIAKVPGPFVLVLDDVHVITEQRVHEALTFLLDHLPPQMHVTVSSRADPPWPLARLRARGEMTELRASDLRFSDKEAAAFLNDVMRLDLSPEDIDALEARAEGWIVGLQMAALSMRGRKDVSGFIRAFTGTHRFILDYLVEEVLDQQSPAVQEFLLRTSILERLTGPLCDAVADRSDSRTVLAQLEQANLFLIPLDDERRWYRYHRLFADLLRSRLEQTHPDQVPTLHIQASEWYEGNGLIAEAVSHALAAGDMDHAVRLIEGNALTIINHGELKTVNAWLSALPDEVVRSRPWLLVAQGWALVSSGQLGGLDAVLQNAKDALSRLGVGGELPEDDEKTRHIAGHIAAIDCYAFTLKRESTRAIQLGHQALQWLPPDDLPTRSFVVSTLGEALYFGGDAAAAVEAFAQAAAISQTSEDPHTTVAALGELGSTCMLQGQLHKAAATLRHALQLAEEFTRRSGRRLPVTGYVLRSMAALLLEWNQLQAAADHVQEAIELCQQWGHAEVLTLAYVVLVRILQAIGQPDAALHAMQEAKHFASGLSPWFTDYVLAQQVQLWLAQGNLQAATSWAERSGLSPSDEVRFQQYPMYGALARVLIAEDSPEKALELLARLLKAAEAAGGGHYVIESLVLQAVALQEQGKLDQALTSLKRALSLAEPEGYVRTFIDRGAPMGKLLQEAAARGIRLDYVRKLLAAWENETKDERPTLKPSSLFEPLTERELQVLRLLPTRLSSTEIAEQLYVSVHTIRSHIKSIYAKLNVHRRIDAIQRAEDLGLL